MLVEVAAPVDADKAAKRLAWEDEKLLSSVSEVKGEVEPEFPITKGSKSWLMEMLGS